MDEKQDDKDQEQPKPLFAGVGPHGVHDGVTTKSREELMAEFREKHPRAGKLRKRS